MDGQFGRWNLEGVARRFIKHEGTDLLQVSLTVSREKYVSLRSKASVIGAKLSKHSQRGNPKLTKIRLRNVIYPS